MPGNELTRNLANPGTDQSLDEYFSQKSLANPCATRTMFRE